MRKRNEMSKHGFDITDFGSLAAWQGFCRELGLHEEPKNDETSRCFVWSNDRSLRVVTQNNPETGEYGPGGRELEVGFASYIGIEGPDYEVANCAAAVRRWAVLIKDERAGVRAYI